MEEAGAMLVPGEFSRLDVVEGRGRGGCGPVRVPELEAAAEGQKPCPTSSPKEELEVVKRRSCSGL